MKQTQAVYRATAFNMSDPPQEEVDKINWEIRTAEETLERFEAKGGSLAFEVPDGWVGKTIEVMPSRSQPSPSVSVMTRISAAVTANGAPSKLVVLDRAAWDTSSGLPRLGRLVDPSDRTEVFIHHTVIVDRDPTPNEWESLDEVKAQMRKLQTIRRADLGADVPYSMVAFCMANGDLVLGEGRGTERSGAHTKGHNSSALGISFQGNFENTPLPAHFDSQLAALGGWLRDLREIRGFVNLGSERPHGREVFAHRDVKSTACPGEHLFAKLHLMRFL